ncbi:MAG: GtrA family protein [Clostridia bacterium]|nr:GtrA family protein [Clostridia bacterium]
MTDFIRKIVFRIINKDSSLGRIADRFLTKEIINYMFFGIFTTVANLVAFLVSSYIFEAVGWQGVLSTLFENRGWQDAAQILSKRGSEYLDSTVIAWIAGVLFAFFTNKLFVFESKSWSPKVAVREFVEFVGARMFSLGVELAGMFVFVSVFDFHEFFSKILISVAVVIINYAFSKLLIFKSKRNGDGKNAGKIA